MKVLVLSLLLLVSPIHSINYEPDNDYKCMIFWNTGRGYCYKKYLREGQYHYFYIDSDWIKESRYEYTWYTEEV